MRPVSAFGRVRLDSAISASLRPIHRTRRTVRKFELARFWREPNCARIERKTHCTAMRPVRAESPVERRRRKMVGGEEDMIVDVAFDMLNASAA